MSRRHHGYRRNGGRRSEHSLWARKRAGWGMGLYRNTRNSRIAGVAAGLAEHWDIAPWVVRLMWVAGFLFTGTLALWAYLAAWILLAPRPTRWEAETPEERPDIEMEYDEKYHDYRPRKVFRYADSPSVRLQRARERLDAALRRVENVESYVTSRQYELNKEFSRL